MNSPPELDEELKFSPRAIEASPPSDKRVRVKKKASQSSYDAGHIGVADDTSDEENENIKRLVDAAENDDSDYVPSPDYHSKAAKNKVTGRGRPTKKMTGHKSDLEKKIEFAEKRIENLSEYEKIRLGNLKDRQDLLNDLNLSNQKAHEDEEEGPDKVFVPPGQKSSAVISTLGEEGTDKMLNDNVLHITPVKNTSVGETSAICQDSTKYNQYSFPPPKQPRMHRPARPMLGTWGPVGYSGRGLCGIRKRLDTTAARPKLLRTVSTNVTRKMSFIPQSKLLPKLNIEMNNNPPSSPALDRLSKFSGVTVARNQSPPPTPTTTWNIPPGITVSRSISEPRHAMTLNSLATALKMLGQVEGERRVVRFMLTEEQINALKTLGVGKF